MATTRLQRLVAYGRRQWRSQLGTLLLVLAVVWGVNAWQTRHLPSGPAPTFSAPRAGPQGSGTLDFERWRADHPGRAVALHFWAEWCPICRAEESSISRLQPDWPVLAVAMQSGDAAHVQSMLARRGLAWTSAVDADGAVARRYGLSAVPAFVVLDPQGRIRSATAGYTPEWSMRLRLWWAQTF